MREDKIVAEELRRRAWVLDNDEVCWNGDDIESALCEIADAGLVILGFDIFERLSGGKIRAWGTSAYEMDASLQAKTWGECIPLARDLAIKDVRDTQRLTGLKPPYSDLWYCVVTVDELEARKLSAVDKTIMITVRRDGIGSCEACGKRFPYYLIDNGLNDTAYAYCNSCGRTAFLEPYTHRPVAAPYKPFEPISEEVEPYLKPCACGGRFTANATPRCPRCRRALSATEAASWIEHNAPGAECGWRWQRTWNGRHCIVIDGRSVSDPWK